MWQPAWLPPPRGRGGSEYACSPHSVRAQVAEGAPQGGRVRPPQQLFPQRCAKAKRLRARRFRRSPPTCLRAPRRALLLWRAEGVLSKVWCAPDPAAMQRMHSNRRVVRRVGRHRSCQRGSAQTQRRQGARGCRLAPPRHDARSAVVREARVTPPLVRQRSHRAIAILP